MGINEGRVHSEKGAESGIKNRGSDQRCKHQERIVLSLSARSIDEGFLVLRLLMILSSISPLFILLGIRGNSLFPDYYFEICCALLAIVPNCILGLRIRSSRRNEGAYQRQVGRSNNDSYHIIIYLFAMLLPFFRQDIDGARELFATAVALAIIVLLFWRFNLHYINLYFLISGYRVFTVHPAEEDKNQYNENVSWTLITRRSRLPIGNKLRVYRISNTVYLEEN